MSRVPTTLLLRQLREGRDQLRARMKADEASRHQWMKQWRSLRAKWGKQGNAQAQEAGFLTMTISETPAHKVFDEIPVEDDALSQAGQDVFDTLEACKDHVQEAFPIMYGQDVVWDEAPLHGLELQSDLLRQLAQGEECLGGEESKLPYEAANDKFCTQVNHSHFLLEFGVNSVDGIFNEISTEMIWDEELLDSLESHNSLLEQLGCGGGCSVVKELGPIAKRGSDDRAHGSDNAFIFELSMSYVYPNQVVWDEMPANLDVHEDLSAALVTDGNLLQQLAWGRLDFDSDTRKPNSDEVTNHVLTLADSSSLKLDSLEHCVVDTDQWFDESHNSLLQQLAWFEGYSVDVEWKPIAKLSTDDKPTYASGPVSELGMNIVDEVFPEVQSTVVEGDTDGVLTDVDCLSQILEFGEVHQTVCNQNGHSVNLQQTIEPGVLVGDQIYSEIVNKVDNSLQLEEQKETCFCRMLASKELVFAEFKPWSCSAFSPGRCEPSKNNSRIALDRQHSDQVLKFDLLADTYLLVAEYLGSNSVWPWDPGIHEFLDETRYESRSAMQRMDTDQVVAWGQATFCGGGNVTPVDMVHTPWVPQVRYVKRSYSQQPLQERQEKKRKEIKKKSDRAFPFLCVGGDDLLSRPGDLVGGHGNLSVEQDCPEARARTILLVEQDCPEARTIKQKMNLDLYNLVADMYISIS